MGQTVPAAIFHRFHIGAAAIQKAAAECPDASARARAPARISRLTRRTYFRARKAWKYLAAQIDLRHFPPSCCG
jgi:hypothetical protein